MGSLLKLGILLVFITSGNCMEPNKKWERIETKLETIYGNQGVPVKFCYNETSATKGVTSVPGCPKSIDGIPWVYYGNPPRCFLAGHHGPCPIGQKLLAVHDTLFGICACECFLDDIQIGKIKWKPIRPNNINDQTMPNQKRYYDCLQWSDEEGLLWQIFDTETMTCYLVNSQGPCERGKVVTGLDFKTKSPVCEERTKDIRVDIDPFSKHGCGPPNDNENLFPTSIASIQTNRCREGERYSEDLRKCVKEQRFVVP